MSLLCSVIYFNKTLWYWKNLTAKREVKKYTILYVNYNMVINMINKRTAIWKSLEAIKKQNTKLYIQNDFINYKRKKEKVFQISKV